MSRRDYVAGESDSMDAILASDRFIEQLRTTGTFEPTSREDAALAFAMLDWRDEVREEPITPPPSVDDLDLSRLTSKQPRRIAQRSVVVAGALLAMSSAAATAFDGDPLRPVRFLVDLGVTVGEGIGNPEDDSSTDGMEPNQPEINGEDVAGEPAITNSAEEHGQPSASDDTEEAKEPSSSDSTDDAGGDATEAEQGPPEAVPTQPQPTEDIEDEDSSGDGQDGEGDDSDDGGETLPPETSEPTDPTDPTDPTEPTEPSDTPPPPDSTTNGEDTEGGEDTDGSGDGETLPTEEPENPDAAQEQDPSSDPAQSPESPDGDELGDIEPIEEDGSDHDGSDHDGSGDDASHDDHSNGWDSDPDSNGWDKHPDSGWWGDRWPPSSEWSDWTSWTSWTDSHGAGHPAWRAGHR